ncbi:MAG: hypothetical protein AAF289_13310, partial [Cyanobacteria bacterium P01_A01_bin.135]
NGTDFTRAALWNAEVSTRRLQNTCCLNSTVLPSGEKTPAIHDIGWWQSSDVEAVVPPKSADNKTTEESSGFTPQRKLFYRGQHV